jgi:hypothetical protein
VILISGVGLLLLTMTNRLARIIDRSRGLATRLRDASDADRADLLGQIDILHRRSGLVQAAITWAGLSVFFVSVLMILLFLTALLQLNWALLVVAFFSASLICLMASMVSFIRDIRLSVVALDMEFEQAKLLARKP